MTDPTASAAKAARLDAAMATEFAAYAHRHGLTVTGDLTATGAVLDGTLGPQHAIRDMEAIMRRWGGQFTATENEDGTLTVAGALAVEAWQVESGGGAGPHGLPLAATTLAAWDFADGLGTWDDPYGPTGYALGPAADATLGTPAVHFYGDADDGNYLDSGPISPGTTGVFSLRFAARFVAFDPGNISTVIVLCGNSWSVQMAALAYATADEVPGFTLLAYSRDGSEQLSTRPAELVAALQPDGTAHTIELIHDARTAEPTTSVYVDGQRLAFVTDATGQELVARTGRGIILGGGSPDDTPNSWYCGPITCADGYQGIAD